MHQIICSHWINDDFCFLRDKKLSWSQFNKFPHSTFNWIGIDGTQVLVHMTPVDTYTAQANLGEVVKVRRLCRCDMNYSPGH